MCHLGEICWTHICDQCEQFEAWASAGLVANKRPLSGPWALLAFVFIGRFCRCYWRLLLLFNFNGYLKRESPPPIPIREREYQMAGRFCCCCFVVALLLLLPRGMLLSVFVSLFLFGVLACLLLFFCCFFCLFVLNTQHQNTQHHTQHRQVPIATATSTHTHTHTPTHTPPQDKYASRRINRQDMPTRAADAFRGASLPSNLHSNSHSGCISHCRFSLWYRAMQISGS